MKELKELKELKRKLIANVLLRDIEEIEDKDIERLDQYITGHEYHGQELLWYLDCDGVEGMIDMQGNIIDNYKEIREKLI